jgi:hypothetical protein
MELENLRTALKNRATSLRSDKSLIASGAASVSVLSKIERSLKWEMGIACAFAGLCLLATFLTESLSERIFLILLMMYTIFFLIRLSDILRKSKEATESTSPVKKCVEESITVVTCFMKFYERLTTWFLPLVFLAAMVAAFAAEFASFGFSMHFPLLTIVASLPIIAGWIWLMQKFSRWWLHRLYGNYLNHLSAQLDELKEDHRYT